MKTLFINIEKLLQVEESSAKWVAGSAMAVLSIINDAYLLINDNLIEDFGSMNDLPDFSDEQSLIEIDVTGRIILPTFCDSHTHLVYAGSREIEYVDKIKGLSYEEIAQRGGGILNSAQQLEKATEQELFDGALDRISEIISFGTGAVEIKSGYGLTTESELKMLRVISSLKKEVPIEIKSTFLGAHAVPHEFKNRPLDYVNLIIDEMIPRVAEEGLADFIDVFCDKGFFTVEDTDRILNQAVKFNLQPKIHANELDYSGGVQVGVKYNALSVDHLEYIGDAEIESLLNSETMPTILPGAAFFLNMPYSPVRDMINAGLPIALASDFNPGSSPSGNMKFIMSLGCINYKMTPEEVINATTKNTAYAMGIHKTHGSISKGKVANLIVTTQIPGYEYLPYAYTSNLIEKVMINGNFID
ncbi:MAG: imidazolonepropionase [Salinivirgaceae bacterium]|jgi:imidazolonepropionase|nr:imidazolonepropionase [Salinivirgaceae bacterium]